MLCGKNLLLSLVKLGSVFPAFSGTSSLSAGCDSRSSFESLKAWTMTVPKRMKRAEKMRDSRGIISRQLL